jgi:hypothetical protein
MASVFASIASRAIPTFRTIWSVIKSSPTLQALGNAVVGQIVKKGT